MNKRKLELVVLSDIHLGTFGCHAKELLQYLKSIEIGTLVLNGDIIDIWQFNKRYFPKAHLAVINHFLKISAQGTKIYYLTGNHDEMLRRFVPFKTENLTLDNKLVLDLDGNKAWFFHGDVFDSSVKCAKWLAKLGSVGYDLLVFINFCINSVLKFFGRPKMSISKKVKDGVKRAVKYINDYENLAAELAIEKSYDYVLLGHIHKAQIKEFNNSKGSVTYLNSGDWIENLSALEYNLGKWQIYYHSDSDNSPKLELEEVSKLNFELYDLSGV